MTIDTEALSQVWKDGFANRDADALTNLYHEDGTLLVPGFEPATGHAKIRAVTETLLAEGIDFAELEPLDLRQSGNLSIEFGLYRFGSKPADGDPIVDNGKYLIVHETRGEITKVIYDCFNSNHSPDQQ